MRYLFLAYLAIWCVLFFYLVRLSLKLHQLREEVALLKQSLKK